MNNADTTLVSGDTGPDHLIRAIRAEIALELGRYDSKLRYRYRAWRWGGYRPECPSTAA